MAAPRYTMSRDGRMRATVRTEVRILPEEWAELEKHAEREKTTVGALIRSAVAVRCEPWTILEELEENARLGDNEEESD